MISSKNVTSLLYIYIIAIFENVAFKNNWKHLVIIDNKTRLEK